MKALRLVLITSMCIMMALAAKAQVKIGENKLETSPHHWLEIDKTDSLFIVTDDLFLGLTDNPHRLGTSPNPATDAIMLKLYGYGLNQFIPSLVSPQVQQTYFFGPVKTNVFAGIADDGSLMEVPLSLIIEVADSSQADLSFYNGQDTFGTADLLVLDTIFATDNELRDSTAVLRTLINNSQEADNDTITGNEYIDEIELIGDSLAFRENVANELGSVNEIGISLTPLIEDVTFYLADGALDENRTVDGATNTLTFNNLDSFEVNANDFVVLNGEETTIQQDGEDIILINAAEDVKFKSGTADSILVLDNTGTIYAGEYGDSSQVGTVSTILAVDGDGKVIEIGIPDILSSDVDSTIYNNDGDLTGDRVLDGTVSQYDLTYDNLGTFDINADSVQLSSVVQGDGFGIDDTEFPATIIGSTADGVLIDVTIDEILASDPDSTIYNFDGDLTGDRVLDGTVSEYDLTYDNLGTFDINADSVQLSSVVQGDGFGTDDTEFPATIIGSTADGVLIDVTIDEILASDPDSTIYTHDGTLTAQRTMTMGEVGTPRNLFFVSPDGLDTTVIAPDGRVGIGTGSFTANSVSSDVKLEVNGDILAIKVHSSSDRRFKKNITGIESALEKVLSIEGVTYDFRQKDFPNRNFPQGQQVGFIAQNVESVLPEVVITNGDGYKAVDYAKITALLNEAIKEQQAQIDILKKELRASDDLNASLSDEIMTIKQMIKDISRLADADED